MGYYELLTKGVTLANSLTEDLQVSVTHDPYASTSADGYATITYGTAVTRNVIASKEAKQVLNSAGQMVVSNSQILIFGNVSVDERDRFTLPDGTQPPIAAVRGTWDKNSGMYCVEVLF